MILLVDYHSVKLPQWALADEVQVRDDSSPTGLTPKVRPGVRPMPKSLKPSLKSPVSLQRQAALQIVSHADLPALYRLISLNNVLLQSSEEKYLSMKL